MSLKVVFFIARYSVSGVPLAQIRLAKSLYRRGYDVEFVIGYVPADLSLPEIEGIKVICLNKSRTYKLLLPIIIYIRKSAPAVIFTAEDHLNAIVTLALVLTGSKAKLSASSRVTPYDTYSNNVVSKKWILKQLNKWLWKRVDVLVCVSKDMVKQYETIFGSTKYKCIYNVIVDSEIYEKMSAEVEEPWMNDSEIPVVVSAGRLAPEKGFADLILAIKLLLERMKVRLVILGDGPLRQELESLINDEGLTDSVKLPGFQKNPYKYFSKAQVFVLSSYVEGLPNVLVEAIACGCTPVATDCPTGPREVLDNGKLGILVPMHNPVQMAEAIEKAIGMPITKDKIQHVTRPFTEEVVIKRHQDELGF